jgi:hypothetical protein
LSSDSVEIVFEPYKKVVVHEVVELKYDEFMDAVAQGGRAAGGQVPTAQWVNGVVFQIQPFNPSSDAVVREQLQGILHYALVSFTTKEKFEGEVHRGAGTVRLINTSSSSTLCKLAETLKAISKNR